jgi:hypothetical protein
VPEGGKPVVIRIDTSKAPQGFFKKESTGDIFANKSIPARNIEVLTDKGWQRLTSEPQTSAEQIGQMKTGMSLDAQKLASAVAAREKIEPDTPVTIVRLRQALPDFTPERFSKAIEELRGKQRIIPSHSDVKGDPNAVDGIMALTTRK